VETATPEYYGSGWDRVPASDVMWSKAVPEWDLYFWIVNMPGVPDGKYSWQQAKPPFLRFHKGLSWTQMLTGSRSLEMDHGVTPDSTPDEIAALGQRLAAAAVASRAAFWQDWIAKKDELHVVRISHEHYVNRGHAPSRYNGFGGSRFRIRFHDGRRVETHDLWHQGTIPPALREELPDNAEFAKDDEAWP
jgi:hypothetical protein